MSCVMWLHLIYFVCIEMNSLNKGPVDWTSCWNPLLIEDTSYWVKHAQYITQRKVQRDVSRDPIWNCELIFANPYLTNSALFASLHGQSLVHNICLLITPSTNDCIQIYTCFDNAYAVSCTYSMKSRWWRLDFILLGISLVFRYFLGNGCNHSLVRGDPMKLANQHSHS